MTLRQIKAIEAANKKKILRCCPDIPQRSGIYFLLREDEGFKYAYIGQAKNLLQRLTEHLKGYQHIDLSLRKHGIYDVDNVKGWKIHFLEFPENVIDEMEQKYIKAYANRGYQLRNKTAGGQGEGKAGLDSAKPVRGYYDGKVQGYNDARKFVANLFQKHLSYQKKSNKPNKNQDKAILKFEEFLKGEENDTRNTDESKTNI